MAKNKFKKKHKKLYNPMQLTKELQELGESYTRKEAALYYGAILLLALILGVLFQLKWYFLLLVVLVYMFFVPLIIYNVKKRSYEAKRFDDANAYMSQMTTSFLNTHNILASLRETGGTFPTGRMNDAISEAIVKIEHAGTNIRETEKSALKIIESGFNCERMRELHYFLLRAEERGGECTVEFSLLERLRITWKEAVLKYQKSQTMIRNVTTISLSALLGICIFLLYKIPERFSIINVPLSQVVNTMMLIVLLVLFYYLDRRLNSSLLRDGKQLSQSEVDTALEYIYTFDARKSAKKYILFAFLVLFLVIVIYIRRRSIIFLGFGILLFIFCLNLHRVVLLLNISMLKDEIRRSFPRWLFDVMLLMQSETVLMAIVKSEKKAPPVLIGEIRRISNMLSKDPLNADAYVSFLADYRIQGVQEVMHKLYSLSVGAGGGLETMTSVIDEQLKQLGEIESERLETKSILSVTYQYLPLLIASIGMMGYCGSLLAVILDEIMGLV